MMMIGKAKKDVIKQFSYCTLARLALFNQNFNEKVSWQAVQRCILDECHIYAATQLYNSPPVSRHQQVHWGGWLQYTGLYWLTMIAMWRHDTYTHAHTQNPHTKTPHKCTNMLFMFVDGHIIHAYTSYDHSSWGTKRKSGRGSLRGPRQIGCSVAHGDNIWERSVLCWWNAEMLVLSAKMHSQLILCELRWTSTNRLQRKQKFVDAVSSSFELSGL